MKDVNTIICTIYYLQYASYFSPVTNMCTELSDRMTRARRAAPSTAARRGKSYWQYNTDTVMLHSLPPNLFWFTSWRQIFKSKLFIYYDRVILIITMKNMSVLEIIE